MARELGYSADVHRRVVTISHTGQVALAQRAAREVAEAVGFAETEREQIAIAASELATNLVRHASGGSIVVSTVTDGQRAGLEILSEDSGPGIAAPEHALTDGYSTSGGLGLGLGAVHRLMDELTFSSSPGGGARIVCRRWVRPHMPDVAPSDLRFGVATHARRGAPENGDCFIVKSWPGHALAGVADGLGHGEPAQRASQAARCYVEEHYDLSVGDLFAGVERACRGSRGVVMALARFDLAESTFALGSVGNIDVRLLGSAEHRRFVFRRGVIGLGAPRPLVTEHPWTPECVLVIHSDGLRSRWDWHAFPQSVWESAAEAAQQLLDAQSRDDDDATVVVVRSARHGD